MRFLGLTLILSDVVGLKVDDTAVGFVEHRAGLDASCARQLEVVNKVGKRAAAVDDVLDDDDVKVCHIGAVKVEHHMTMAPSAWF